MYPSPDLSYRPLTVVITDETPRDREQREAYFELETIDSDGVTFRLSGAGAVYARDRSQRLWIPLHRLHSVGYVAKPEPSA